MNLAAIRQLIDAVERSSLTSLAYEDGEVKITLSRNASPIMLLDSAQPVAEIEPVDARVVVKSPVVGTVYRAREPGGTPLVSVGDVVKPGDALCVIEAMKFFSDVVSPCAGTVAEIAFTDGALAEFGATLVYIGETA